MAGRGGRESSVWKTKVGGVRAGVAKRSKGINMEDDKGKTNFFSKNSYTMFPFDIIKNKIRNKICLVLQS